MTMKPTEKPALRLTIESIRRSFLQTSTPLKRHLIVTGGRGAGKSTLAKELFSLLTSSDSSMRPLPIFTTHAVPYDHVVICDPIGQVTAEIGNYHDNQMYANPDGFLSVGIPALQAAYESASDWVLLDELGFLESSCPAFQQAVTDLFERKHVLAVLRKQSTPFLDSIRNRNDCFVYDLDRPVDDIGCVIMASGEGKRFGSNKLMAAFHENPLISNILNITGSSLFSNRIVVTRHADVAEYCNAGHIPVLLHSFPQRNDTVRLGLSKLLAENPALKGCMFCVADQPFLTRESLETMVLTFSQHRKTQLRHNQTMQIHPCQINYAPAILPLSFADITGNPVLFSKDFFGELLTLPAGKGGGFVLQHHREHVFPVLSKLANELYDIDTKAELNHMEKM